MLSEDRFPDFLSLCAREPNWLARLRSRFKFDIPALPEPRRSQEVASQLERVFRLFEELSLCSRAGVVGWEELHAATSTLREAVARSTFLPCWNGRRGLLTFAGVVLIQFGRAAPMQASILDAFEKANWAASIDNPVPDGDYGNRYEQMRTAIKGLNAHQCVPLLHFRGNGQRGVRWEFAADPCLLEDLLLS